MDATDLLHSIGNTPLVQLPRLAPHPGVRFFAKLEGQNPTGSVKDRIALAMVEAAEQRGEIRAGDTLVEASTGNTAIALAMVARRKGYELHVVLPEGIVPTIHDLLALYGVEITWSEPRVGMLGAIEKARELARTRGWYATCQFENPANVDIHYRATGEEIARALPEIDVLVAGMGTGGTITGVGRRLRETNPALRIIGVEPRLGDRLQGLRHLDDAYRAPLIDLELLNGRFQVGSDQALAAAQRITRVEGILAGVSSGASLVAALRVAERVRRGTFVLVFPDGGWKYLPVRPWEAALAGDRRVDEMHWW